MNYTQALHDISESNERIILSTTGEEFSIFLPDTKVLYEFPYKDLTAEEKDLADSVFHGIDGIYGIGLKNSIKSLVENGILSDIFDVTNRLIDLEVVQHIVNENAILEIQEQGLLVGKEEYFIEFSKKSEELISSLSEKQVRLLNRIEGPLIKVLVSMELEGISVDKKYLEAIGEDIECQIIKVGGKLAAAFGTTVLNLNSPKQIAHLFFEVMKIPVKSTWKTPAGAISVAAHVINEIAEENPQVKEIIEYRELVKMKGTSIDGFVSKMKNGKIHSSFHQTGTVTGRLSSSSPNLQNVPTGEKYDIRKAFHSREGYSFIDADYSQIELRLMAHFSGDEILINAFKEGRDIHQETATKLGISRSQAKGINFGIIYGMSSYGFAETMGVPVDEAKMFIKKYFEAFPKVREFIDRTKKELGEQGYGETLFGRRRHFPEYQKSTFVEKNRIERQVVNARIQGSAADVMKIALVSIFNGIRNYDAKILVTVHDEVIVEVNDNQLEEVKEIIKTKMELKNFAVPITADIKTSKVWKK